MSERSERVADTASATDVFEGVVGQTAAVAQLRAAASAPVHAYLFVGPSGTGARGLARAFAGALLCRDGGCGTCRDCRLALAGAHPDVEEVEPDKTRLSADQARTIRERAALASVEGGRRVVVVDGFETAVEAAPMLLKTIEEPREGVVFVLLAERVPPELTTVASRCARVDLVAVPSTTIESTLVGEGVEPDRARAAAAASGGLVERARLLASDSDVTRRHEAWQQVPYRLDGTGGAVAVLVDELAGLIDAAAAPLRERHAAEVAELDERVQRTGERGSGRRDLEARHRRELRRHRLEELRLGLATLARSYAAAGADPSRSARAVRDLLAAVGLVDEAAAMLVRNPNETLLLQALLLRLPPLAPD